MTSLVGMPNQEEGRIGILETRLHLKPLIVTLLQNLKGCAPLFQNYKDSGGWGKMGYSVKQGYYLELQKMGLPPISNKWGSIWNPNILRLVVLVGSLNIRECSQGRI
jgi:hypothetical protein